MKQITTILTLFLLILTLNALSFAADYYVDALNGDNANSGISADDAWKTITYADSQIKEFVYENIPITLYIAAGTYNEALGEDFPRVIGSTLSLKGMDKLTTIIESKRTQFQVFVIFEGKGNIVENLTITGSEGGAIECVGTRTLIRNCLITGNSTPYYGAGLHCSYCLNGELRIENCVIKDNYAGLGGGIFCFFSSPTIQDCIIEDNMTSSGIDSGYGGGLYCTSESHPIIVNSLFSNNIGFFDGGAIYCQGSSSPKIFNSTFHSNIAPNGSCICITDGNKTSIVSSILWGNNCASISGSAKVSYSNIQGGYEGEGNIDDNPMFVSGAWGDYYLSQISAGQDADSSCIDAGSEIPIMGFNPKDYITRTDSVGDMGIVDMGYHYPMHIQFELGINPIKFTYKTGDELNLCFSLITAPEDINADLYLILLKPEVTIYSGMVWDKGISPLVLDYTLPANLDMGNVSLLTFILPSTTPPVDKPGTYTFYLAALKPGTVDFISNIATTSFTTQ
ncbi:hypothetical protein KKB18_13090 [bacterium]|nr:hypothetical protein [bacterium]